MKTLVLLFSIVLCGMAHAQNSRAAFQFEWPSPQQIKDSSIREIRTYENNVNATVYREIWQDAYDTKNFSKMNKIHYDSIVNTRALKVYYFGQDGQLDSIRFASAPGYGYTFRYDSLRKPLYMEYKTPGYADRSELIDGEWPIAFTYKGVLKPFETKGPLMSKEGFPEYLPVHFISFEYIKREATVHDHSLENSKK